MGQARVRGPFEVRRFESRARRARPLAIFLWLIATIAAIVALAGAL